MKLIRDRERESGICGEKTDFTDSLGNTLYVGDIVVLVNKENSKGFKLQNENVVVKDSITGKYEIMGLYGTAKKGFIKNPDWAIYRAIPYYEVPQGFCIDGHKYCSNEIKEMTISEIEKQLGYSIKIIKED